jgi:hypothetical protein
MTETALCSWCLEYLHRIGIAAWKNNTGGLTDKNGQYVQFGTPGAPDIMGILASQEGRMLCIETKVGKNKLSQAQADWLFSARSHGAACAVIYTQDEMMSYVESNFGLMGGNWNEKLDEHIRNAKPAKIKLPKTLRGKKFV